MKEDITELVAQCDSCKTYYVIGVEGEFGICDKCLAATEIKTEDDE